MDPVLSFKVYPVPRSRLYFDVWIFETKEAMEEGTAHLPDESGDDDPAVAVTFSWNKPEHRAVRPRFELGVIAFAASDSGGDTVAHECVHAAIAFVYRRKLMGQFDVEDPNDNGTRFVEEIIASVTDRLYAQIKKKWR